MWMNGSVRIRHKWSIKGNKEQICLILWLHKHIDIILTVKCWREKLRPRIYCHGEFLDQTTHFQNSRPVLTFPTYSYLQAWCWRPATVDSPSLCTHCMWASQLTVELWANKKNSHMWLRSVWVVFEYRHSAETCYFWFVRENTNLNSQRHIMCNEKKNKHWHKYNLSEIKNESHSSVVWF